MGLLHAANTGCLCRKSIATLIKVDILASLYIGACGHRSGRFRCPNLDCNILRSTSTTLPADGTDAYSWFTAIAWSMLRMLQGTVRGHLNR